MSTCRFCGGKFANAQAVRAHLKGCAEYQSRPRNAQPEASSLDDSLGNDSLKAWLPEAPSQADGPFDPVRQLAQRLAAERLRLQLREVEEAHAELDRRAHSKKHEREREASAKIEAAQAAERERIAELKRSENSQRERERRDAAEQEKRSRRREAIQNVKRQVVDCWWPDVTARSDLKSRVLKEVETTLAPLAVEDIPRNELVLIAEGIRDRLYHEAKDAEQNSQRFDARRRELIAFGKDYAARELRVTQDLPLSDIWRIERRVQSELESIEASETRDDIEDRVESILEDEGIGWDDDED